MDEREPILKRLWAHPTTIGIMVGAAVLVVALAITVTLHLGTGSLVPAAVSKRLAFPVYYPDPKKLPPGYKLDVSSFRVADSKNEAALYTVRYAGGKKLIFTVQQKPSDDELSLFVKNYIPIHREVLTQNGKATIGAIGKQTVASLPTDTKAWILMTGPSDIYGTDQLAQVLKALKK